MRSSMRIGMALVAAWAVLAAAPSGAAERSAPGAADAAARRQVAGLRQATAVNDADGNKIFDDLDAALRRADGGRLGVIVSFVGDVPTGAGVARVDQVAPGARVARTFTIVPAFAGELTAHEAAAVAALPEVRQIELDRAGVPELASATRVMGADAVVDGLGIDGSLDGVSQVVSASDVTIAILDTGFDVGHVDLDGKLEAFVDLADAVEEPYDSDGHGTHVASIAAGWGAGSAEQRGVAPGAGIVGLRIENASHALAGYEWILENRDVYDIRVATMSFGFGVATDGTTALERAVDAVWNAGVVCFKSNGNSGPSLSTMTVPAAARGIIAMGSLLDPAGGTSPVVSTAAGPVGSVAKYGFLLSEFSSRGPTTDGRIKPDLVAPGESIQAADAGTAAGYITLSGTSMASPFGAGTAALIVAANPTLTPDQVRAIMTSTTEDFGAPGPDNEFGHGRVQVLDAVEAALRIRGVEPPAVQRPAVPLHVARAVPATNTGGISIPVTSTSVPVAVSAIGGSAVPGIVVRDPDGLPVPAMVTPNADRQAHVSFMPAKTGTYTVTAMTGTTPAVVDVSFR